MSVRMDAKNYNFMNQAGEAYCHFRICHDNVLPHEEERGIDCYKEMEAIDPELSMKVISFYAKERQGPFGNDMQRARWDMLSISVNTGPVDTKAKAVKAFFVHYGFAPGCAMEMYKAQVEHPIYRDDSLASVPLKQYATCIVWDLEETLAAVGIATASVAGCFLLAQGGGTIGAVVDKQGFKDAMTNYSDQKLAGAWNAVKEVGQAVMASEGGDVSSAYEHATEAAKSVFESFTTPFPNPSDYTK